MKRFSWLTLAAAFAAFCLFGAIPSEAAQPSAKPAASKTTDSDIDPAAIEALNKMGAYLRTLKAFQVTATTSTDDVTDDGQLVTADAVSSLLAQVPNHLRVEITSDDEHRIYFYDGTTVTVFAALANFYATSPAPPTISQLADVLYDKYDISLPLEDLFFWGTARGDTAKVKGAFDSGPSQVDGVTCEQYVFRQDGMDWQIWIQNGDFPLPRKLVLTTTTDPAKPRHTSVLTWNLAPSFNEAAFVFDPPKDAQKVVLAEIHPSSGNSK